METSDSEYFESADEDFGSEDEFNKNTTSTKDNSINTCNLPKDINKIHNLSDVNKNKNTDSQNVNQDNKINLQGSVTKTNSSTEEQRIKTPVPLATEDKPIDEHRKTVPLTIDDKTPFRNEKQIEESSKITVPLTADDNTIKNEKQIEECKKTGIGPVTTDDKTTVKNEQQIDKPTLSDGARGELEDDDAEDNLWNEGEGWGVEDENDTSGTDLNPQKVSATNTLLNIDKKSNNKNEVSSIQAQAPVEGENMWDSDEWDNWESVNEEKIPKNEVKADEDSNNSSQMWKGWSNWGVTSILSTASQSVSTLTNSVSHGLSTVLETGIGAPDPEELAVLNKEFEKKSSISTETSCNPNEEHENKNLLGFGLSNFGNLVSGVSKLVESTSTKMISGGLDTLETIGKKTMEVIQDGDPGLKKKRAFLKLEGEKPVLSQVLRDAKEKAEQENKALQEKHFARKINYESIFDDHQGLVHLEALEMLSKQCDLKLQLLIESSSGKSLTDIQETLDQVKELCELPDEEEDEQISKEELKDRLKSAVEEIGVNITYDKLISMWEETECWLNNLNLNICDEHEIHQQAVETLAQLTAIAVEQFHRAGELLLIKDHHSTADEADSLVQLTTTLTSLIGIVAAKFSDKMNTKVTENSNKEDINSLITNIFFEAANSSSYIQDAFQLLVPVLQMGAV